MSEQGGARLILASGSAARRAMLEAAGLRFDAIPANIDEDALRSAMVSESDCVEAADIALALAGEKARCVSQANTGAVVIGSDQVLALGRRNFSKAETIAEARQNLATLRGATHELVSGVALARDGTILWQAMDSAQMTMRAFSEAFLDSYLAQAGDRVLHTVGCYEIEGPGVQLFERIEGDYFTILGMPLLPLLAELRERGMIAA